MPYGGVFYCTTLLLPQHDFKRAQRRHYDYLFNHSSIELSPPPPPPRATMLNSFYRDQKRHFCRKNTESHLDKYF
ncbi:hypothetical protein ILUMI_07082 [Ignelater luminosus]|uniref:Uncharacterized protein n=1 Tax=Ignelater luminosus TaxID=2038154 RepID=A0A8K0D462_IGNLU|nr:hypothetical protein ILUMI_07082 [Ignelater luminosus]